MEGHLPLVIFVLMSVAASMLAHKFLTSFPTAVAVSTLFVTPAYQALTYLLDGYLDPFFLIAIIYSSLYAALISSLVGLPFAYRRRDKR
jgi:hypothetical protein